MHIVVNGSGLLSIQLLILFFIILQTMGVFLILYKFNIGLNSIFSLASPVKKNNRNQPFYATF